tara:strand:- start:2027 stop:2230 length:204 start_codon:yes stop_codon:yes gene_type:complete
MEDNQLLMIVLAFVLGCMCSGMMKQMCGGRLVEGSGNAFGFDKSCTTDSDCRGFWGMLTCSGGKCGL